MGIGKGIPLSSGFDLNSKAPLDNRTIFETTNERDSLPDINLYEGLECYVKETKNYYQYIDNTWKLRSSGGISEGELDNIYSKIDTDIEEVNTKINTIIEEVNANINSINTNITDIDTSITEINSKIDTKSPLEHSHISSNIAYTTDADTNIQTIQDALDKLLYVTLTVNFSSNTSGVLEKGSAISNLTFNWSYNKNVKSQTINGEDLEPSLRTYQYSEVLNANKTFTLKANDGKSDFSKSLSYSFIYPIYIGSVSTDTPTESDIKAMTKKVVNPSNQSFTYTVDNKRMCICVPSNWTIRSIIDPNNFNITSSFKQTTINLQCLDTTQQSYKVYISEPTSQSNFVVKYNV